MLRPWGYPLLPVARRFVARAAYRVVRNTATVLLVTVLMAGWILAGEGPFVSSLGGTSGAEIADQSAAQYMRALRDRDSVELFRSLSPGMRGRLERQAGLGGPAAATWFFNEGERRGERIVDYRMVGSDRTIQGDKLYFYVVRAERGSDRRDIPYTLTVSSDGKVTGVE
jgi:hypothetical protein